jgi:hypothetical protein
MVISPEIAFGGNCPEGGELLNTSEFKKRLEMTVAFLKVNQRPYWEAVAREPEDFLKSLKE